jgi:hypothetical protein
MAVHKGLNMQKVGTANVSVAKEVAEVQKLLKASGLTHTMHSAGTTVGMLCFCLCLSVWPTSPCRASPPFLTTRQMCFVSRPRAGVRTTAVLSVVSVLPSRLARRSLV